MLYRDFKYLSDPLFLVSSIIYVINKTSSLFTCGPGWLRLFAVSYLNDLLLVPVVIPIILFFSKALKLRPRSSPPSPLELATPVLIWSIAFEVVGPYLFRRGIPDPYDVGAYCIGGLASWLIWRRPVSLMKKSVKAVIKNILEMRSEFSDADLKEAISILSKPENASYFEDQNQVSSNIMGSRKSAKKPKK